MTSPWRGRRYLLHRAWTRLLVGPTGSGKTYSLLALIRDLVRADQRDHGSAARRASPRVLKLRPSQFLSKWLGESDKRLDSSTTRSSGLPESHSSDPTEPNTCFP